MLEPATAQELTFPSTHWSSIHAAGAEDSEESRQALGALIQRYRPAITAYLITKFRCQEEDARDLFQGFVEAVVLERGLIVRARRMRGHQFRSFLLTALHNFATSQFRREQAQKRQPAGGLVSLDVLEAVDVVSMPPSAVAFDAAWARWVVAAAIQRMQDECAAHGRADVWEMFEARLKGPIFEGHEPVPYPALVERLGLQSPSQAQNLLITAKRTFARCVRAVVGEYVIEPEAVETEVLELLIILSHDA
jgi:DNA-directed RNA polymerase specialized sigma24 family protein